MFNLNTHSMNNDNKTKLIRKYHIQKIENVANLERFANIDSYYEQTTIRISDKVIAQIRLSGKTCYFHNMTMLPNDYVLKQVMLFVKMWNADFDNRPKNKIVNFKKRNDAELEQNPKFIEFKEAC